jgi:hypothetical protein
MGLTLLPNLAFAAGGFYKSCKQNVGPVLFHSIIQLALTD